MKPISRFVYYVNLEKLFTKGASIILFMLRIQILRLQLLDQFQWLIKFTKVFLKYLPRFPLEREVNFEINPLPSTQPNSIPPYRMVPIELKELKDIWCYGFRGFCGKVCFECWF